jgi:tetratricopeptide (TPR) repeat protein
MRKRLNKSYLFLIICVIFTVSGCDHFNPNLKKAEGIMEEHPDSALKILRGIKSPRSLSEKDYALYALLVTQATDKNDLDLTKDFLSDYAVRYFGQSKDSVHTYKAFFYAGRVNEEMKNANQAISYYLKAKDFARNSKDYKYLYFIHYYLGNLYVMQNLFKDGINSYKEAYQYASMLKSDAYRCLSLSEIGFGYSCLEKEDSALIYQFKALKIAEKGDKKYISHIYNQICGIYSTTGKYKLALQYSDKALACKQKHDDLFTFYVSKGDIYKNLHQYDSAIIYLNKSIQSDYIYTKAAGYSCLAGVYEAQGNTDKALYYMKQFNLYRDTIDTQTQSKAIIETQEIYKHDKLKEENLLLKEDEAEKNRSFYRLSLFTSLILLLGGYIYFLNYRKSQKQKEQIRKDRELLQEITINKIQREKEVIQKEAELKTDFYKRLNSISIPWLINLSDSNKEEQFNNHIKLAEQDWNRIIENTDTVFNNFTKRLKETFPKMNEMDIRLCCLIKVQLSQSEMADILNIEKVSIKRRKLRIRKDKMMIDDGRTLDEIVLNF